MKIELSLNGTRIFLLSLGLLLVSLLMFFAGMVFTVGRVRSGTGVVTRIVERGRQPEPAKPQVIMVPAPRTAVRRLKPIGIRRPSQRMTPVPVLNQPPSAQGLTLP